MTRPLLQRPAALLSVGGLRFWARASYAAGWKRCAALGVEYAVDSEVEEGLHAGKTGAEDAGVGFQSGPDGGVDEVVCRRDVRYFVTQGCLGSRTGEVSRMAMNGNGV